MDERLRSHYESLQRAIEFIRQADAKATPLIIAQVALVGALATRVDKLSPIILQPHWGLGWSLLVVLIALYLAFLVAVIVSAGMVYFPRNPKSGSESLIYFEDIAAMPREKFAQRAVRMTPDDVEGQLIDQIHRVSEVVSVKMRRVRWAFILSAPATLLWLILLVWGSTQSTPATLMPPA